MGSKKVQNWVVSGVADDPENGHFDRDFWVFGKSWATKSDDFVPKLTKIDKNWQKLSKIGKKWHFFAKSALFCTFLTFFKSFIWTWFYVTFCQPIKWETKSGQKGSKMGQKWPKKGHFWPFFGSFLRTKSRVFDTFFWKKRLFWVIFGIFLKFSNHFCLGFGNKFWGKVDFGSIVKSA